MTTSIHETTVFGWYCAICGEGDEDYDFESQAQKDADEHDRENHGDVVPVS